MRSWSRPFSLKGHVTAPVSCNLTPNEIAFVLYPITLNSDSRSLIFVSLTWNKEWK
jgi:hypothetical protein